MRDNSNQPFKPTTKLIIKLGRPGVHLHTSPGAPASPLQYHELVAISELETGSFRDVEAAATSVANLTGVQEADVQRFLKFLIRSGRLRRRRHAIPRIEAAQTRDFADPLAALPDRGLIGLKLPLTLNIQERHFQLIDHDGRLAANLSAAQLVAIAQFAVPTTFAEGFAAQQGRLGEFALDEADLDSLLRLLRANDLLQVSEMGDMPQEDTAYLRIFRENIARSIVELDRLESRREQEAGVVRPKVIPVTFGDCIPAALGLVVAYAKCYREGVLDEFYDFRLDWLWDESRAIDYARRPAIYLFSNYLWTHEKSIVASELIKRLNPNNITIHGGPDSPKYEGDAQEYFARYPHVDILVRGEGEATAADTLDKLRAVIGQADPDLSVLRDVPGITYRQGGEIVRNPDRERIEDLDTIPSPYLMGLFDVYRGVPGLHVTLETNRGCPYGCTFCDWGSATLSKIRKFDIDRVYGELEWCADMKVFSVSQADANFGIFERDVDIAQKVADLKRTFGYPAGFGGSFAKNSTKYLRKIIKILADAGILAQGVLSLQTMDESTLQAIKRSNIKVEKYDALANEMRSSSLPLTVELMMGLPGATLQSFIEDLQQCIDREIPARINHTTLLVNSPMNNPEYRAKHQIVTGAEVAPGKMPVLVSTATYSRSDMEEMIAIQQIYTFLDNFGVMRLSARFVRQQTGMTEMEFYQKLRLCAGTYNKQRLWPILNTLLNYGHELMAPPFSWAAVYAELRRFLVSECEVPDDSALDSIMSAQHALQPAHGRAYPLTIELPHDVVSWHSGMLMTKTEGHWRDWHLVLPPLSSFPPGSLSVNDADGSVTALLGSELATLSEGANWDMDSGIARARVAVRASSSAQLKSADVILTA